METRLYASTATGGAVCSVTTAVSQHLYRGGEVPGAHHANSIIRCGETGLQRIRVHRRGGTRDGGKNECQLAT